MVRVVRDDVVQDGLLATRDGSAVLHPDSGHLLESENSLAITRPERPDHAEAFDQTILDIELLLRRLSELILAVQNALPEEQILAKQTIVWIGRTLRSYSYLLWDSYWCWSAVQKDAAERRALEEGDQRLAEMQKSDLFNLVRGACFRAQAVRLSAWALQYGTSDEHMYGLMRQIWALKEHGRLRDGVSDLDSGTEEAVLPTSRYRRMRTWRAEFSRRAVWGLPLTQAYVEASRNVVESHDLAFKLRESRPDTETSSDDGSASMVSIVSHNYLC